MARVSIKNKMQLKMCEFLHVGRPCQGNIIGGRMAACIRHQRRETTIFCHKCLIKTGVEKRTTFEYRLEL